MITCLLIFVAFGWTITFIKDAEFDLYIPLISMLGLINLILTLLGKVNDGDSDKYHMYDTIPSYLLVFFRVVTVAILLIGIIKTYSENKGNEKITRFYIRFSILGGCYFLSLPAIMILATWIPVSSRKMIVFICVEMVKNFVNLALTWMVSSKKSMYSSIRANSTSFMEKDNKLLWMMVEYIGICQITLIIRWFKNIDFEINDSAAFLDTFFQILHLFYH